eukprot:s1451_g15.t1
MAWTTRPDVAFPPQILSRQWSAGNLSAASRPLAVEKNRLRGGELWMKKPAALPSKERFHVSKQQDEDWWLRHNDRATCKADPGFSYYVQLGMKPLAETQRQWSNLRLAAQNGGNCRGGAAEGLRRGNVQVVGREPQEPKRDGRTLCAGHAKPLGAFIFDIATAAPAATHHGLLKRRQPRAAYYDTQALAQAAAIERGKEGQLLWIFETARGPPFSGFTKGSFSFPSIEIMKEICRDRSGKGKLSKSQSGPLPSTNSHGSDGGELPVMKRRTSGPQRPHSQGNLRKKGGFDARRKFVRYRTNEDCRPLTENSWLRSFTSFQAVEVRR